MTIQCYKLAIIILDESELATIFENYINHLSNETLLILGSGSNIVFTGDFNGLILLMQNKGKKLLKQTDKAWYVSAKSGENWHEFVKNLAYIPGTVGAAPVQNIGAYGIEVEKYIDQIKIFDRFTQEFSSLSKEHCAFSYRDSIFKHQDRHRFIITEVIFKFPKQWQAILSYDELKKYLSKV
ncbi:hypothetical protein ACTFIZ_007962 [Dictyostelium cf. discoideum]